MHQAPESSRLQLELREETWTAPGLTALPWTTGCVRSTAPPSHGAPPECSCPADCARDHENE